MKEGLNEMTTAAAPNEYRRSIGHDFTPADTQDAEYIGAEAAEDVDPMSTEQRQALNARMADWYGIG